MSSPWLTGWLRLPPCHCICDDEPNRLCAYAKYLHLGSPPPPPGSRAPNSVIKAHPHIPTHTHMYIISHTCALCMCVCVCVCCSACIFLAPPVSLVPSDMQGHTYMAVVVVTAQPHAHVYMKEGEGWAYRDRKGRASHDHDVISQSLRLMWR